jgi:predicted RNA binding protein YcfA (HicA-like mRNA interferase family)
MSRKLPALRPKAVMRAMERAGFRLVRITGSHHIYEHPSRPDQVVPVPLHNRDLKRGTLHNIIKQAGLTEEEFLDLL